MNSVIKLWGIFSTITTHSSHLIVSSLKILTRTPCFLLIVSSISLLIPGISHSWRSTYASSLKPHIVWATYYYINMMIMF